MLLLAACAFAPSSADPDQDGDGWTVDAGDCDDGDASVFPGAMDLCNQGDDDCDGAVDEGACLAYDPAVEGDPSVLGEGGLGWSVLPGHFDGDSLGDVLAVATLDLAPAVCLVAGARLTGVPNQPLSS